MKILKSLFNKTRQISQTNQKGASSKEILSVMSIMILMGALAIPAYFKLKEISPHKNKSTHISNQDRLSLEQIFSRSEK